MSALLDTAGVIEESARRPSALGRPIVDAAFLRDPYPTYRSLREAGPIHWSDEFFGGAWLLTHHADVEMVLRDARFSAQRTGGWVKGIEDTSRELAPFQQLFARAMLFVDNPEHSRLRKVMNAGFRPQVLRRLAPYIEQEVARLLDALEDMPSFDFMEALARPLPVRVISRLMGIDSAPHDAVMAWSDNLAAFIGSPAPTRDIGRRAQASLLAMTRYFEALLPAKRREPGDDLVSGLLQAQNTGEFKDEAELLSQCAMLLFAGHETTRNLLGNGLSALLTHPEQWERLRCDPSLVPAAVRELLRYDSPVQYTGRRVTTDLQLHGQVLRRGELVVPLIGAANRDPTRYERPDVLDITRNEGSSLSFGSGPHVCIGAMLTRMEAEALLRQLVVRRPDLCLAEPAGVGWGYNAVYRGVIELPMVSSGRPCGSC